MGFISSRKDPLIAIIVTLLLIGLYSGLIYDISDSFPKTDGKNKEIFYLSILPLLVGVILKTMDSLVGNFFHSNSSDAEKGELAFSLLDRFEQFIDIHLSSDDSRSAELAYREAGRCAELVAEIYEGIHCSVQRRGVLTVAGGIFPRLAAKSHDFSGLKIFNFWCGVKGDLAQALYDGLCEVQAVSAE